MLNPHNNSFGQCSDAWPTIRPQWGHGTGRHATDRNRSRSLVRVCPYRWRYQLGDESYPWSRGPSPARRVWGQLGQSPADDNAKFFWFLLKFCSPSATGPAPLIPGGSPTAAAVARRGSADRVGSSHTSGGTRPHSGPGPTGEQGVGG